MQFRKRAFRSAAASTALRMQWPFCAGMSFAELVHAFKFSDVLPIVPSGGSVELDEPAILMSGTVEAFTPAAKRPNLKRQGNLGAYLGGARTPALLSPALARESAAEGRYEAIEAPALLETGSYPAKAECTVRAGRGPNCCGCAGYGAVQSACACLCIYVLSMLCACVRRMISAHARRVHACHVSVRLR